MRPCPTLAALLLLTLAPAARAQAPAAPAAAEPAPVPEAAPQAEAAPEPAGPPPATPSSLSATATPDRVKLGEAFRYVIEIRDAKDQRYELPRELGLGKQFDVIRVEVTRTPKDGDLLTRFVLEAALFDLGEQRLADLQLQASGPTGARILDVPGPTVVGLGVIGEDEQAEPGDILPPVPVSVILWRRLYAVLGGLAAAFLLLLLVRWLRHRPRRERAAPPPPPPLPAHQRALRALEALQREELPAQGLGREFHFRLSEILRDYLGERFGFSALDMTTAQLLAALARLETPGLDYPRFEALCREGDLVKFAKAPAGPGDCKVAIDTAFGLVRATAPQGPDPRRPGSPAGVAA